MRLLKQMIHPALLTTQGVAFKRQAARGIVARDAQLLLLFTERYDDFSFPGGGVEDGEALIAGLARELEEETGARGVRVTRACGTIEEFRPCHKPGYDLMHMLSHFFFCEIEAELGEVRLEGYEIANGMRPMWVNLSEAIAHNEAVMRRQDQRMGQSIQRETFMLHHVADELRAQATSSPQPRS